MIVDIMSRAEKEEKVLDLYYNQSKGYDKIAKELHMSFSTINDIIKRDRQQKEKEKESEANIDYDGGGNGNGNGKAEQQQQQHQIIPTTSTSAIIPSLPSAAELEDLSDKQKAVLAYKLYDQGKSPVQVSTTLCLPAKEAIAYQQEFWRLKGHHQLYQIYREIEQSLPSFLKLFNELKRQGLIMQNVKWFVDGLNIGTIKMEDIHADSENIRAENQNQRIEHENLRYENQSLRNENQDIVNGIQYNRRIFENDSKAMKEQTTELIKLQKQQQQNVDTLSERIATLYNKERELNVRVSRFKDINQTYRKVKTIAQEQVNRFWSQALKEPDKKGLLSIVLSAVIETLRQRPDTNEIIFGSDNNVGNNERQDAIISVAQRLSNSLIERMVNQTLEKLETQAQTDEDEDEDADTDTDTESDVLEAIEEAQDTVVAAEAKVKDTEVDDAAAKEEEEPKPKPEEET